MSLTPKAQRTRAQILEVALQLFAERGYAQTTMRDIASEAGFSTGLTYRYFRRKEELALALYAQLADQLVEVAADLPEGSAGERVAALLQAKLDLLEPHRGALTALFAAALDPKDDVGVLSDATGPVRKRVQEAFRVALAGSDLPAAQVEAMVPRIYGLHLLAVLAWTQDRTEDHAVSRQFVALVRDLLAFGLPLLQLPVAAPMLGRLDAFTHTLLHREEA